MAKKERLSEIEKAMADHPKGRPFKGNRLYMDPKPVAPPVGYEKQPSMMDIIRQQVQQASRAAEEEGWESVEEANDFECPDDPFPSSPYEFTEEEIEVPPSVRKDRIKQEQKDALEETETKAEGAGGVPHQSDPPDTEETGETPA